MISAAVERRLLQLAVFIAAVVPVYGGLTGALRTQAAGAAFAGHFNYLSGLLLGVGLAFWFSVPRIETHGRRFRLLAAIVVLGGLARAIAAIRGDRAGGLTLFALTMELGVTPALCLWQARVAARSC